MLRILGELQRDLSYAWRLAWKSPGLATVTVLTLALGTGAATAVFTIVNAVLLRPLPYRDPSRLVDVLDHSLRESGLAKIFASYPDFREWKQHARGFEDLAAITWAVKGQTLTGHGPALPVTAIPVSDSFFTLLGVKPALGRAFTGADLERGCSVVLSNSFWTGVFGADPNVVGRSLSLDQRSCAVLGVMPPAFAFYPGAAQLWTLLTPGFSPPPGDLPVIVVGRLRPGVTAVQAQAELAGLHAALHRADGKERDIVPVVDNLQDEFTWLAGRNLRTTLWVLLAAVGSLLLIACLNVAGLMLARSLARGREFAVRAALGGGRARLARQLLTEGLVLSSLGGALGVLVAFGSVRYFRAANPVEMPVGADIGINGTVLVFTVVVSVATALLCGLAPAWQSSRADLNEALKSGGRAVSAGGGRHRLARTLVMAEVALSVVLLASAGLLIESVLRMGSAPLGFEPSGVFHARIALPRERYPDAAARNRFYAELLDRLAASPGVRDAALASTLPPLQDFRVDDISVRECDIKCQN